ncbi:hypothetical protein [Paenibacillus cremeus]|uniref:Uncharacterized protein n=1 Tax=Paenibacillus cremeus TaxID=2163881 RepID=A0A559K6E7_9BACL|nr:hypothetical protein [Paenibacillus cremeus]TVY07715.1 hypothetical protein FPZ49_22815 [Paenibacillus cremeus]
MFRKPKNNELATVQSQRNEILAQEFPEGPYGSSFNHEALGKSTPWLEDQQAVSAYAYENQELHAGISRDYPGEDSTNEDMHEDELQ